MTSPLPKKRPITVRGGSRTIRTTCSFLVLWSVAYTSSLDKAGAQQPPPAAEPYAPSAMTVSRQRKQQPPLPPDIAEPLPSAIRPPEPWEQPAPYTIQLEPPSIYRVAISVESDAQLHERIRQENRERKMPGGKMPERLVFPNDPIISTDTYQGRKWYPMRLE